MVGAALLLVALLCLIAAAVSGFVAMSLARGTRLSPTTGFSWGFVLGVIGIAVVAYVRTRDVGRPPAASLSTPEREHHAW